MLNCTPLKWICYYFTEQLYLVQKKYFFMVLTLKYYKYCEQ